ncbi:hypothetical protein O9H85_36145 [Paenibacillus filicis]|uniref:RiboL-PSP-HEPN domain-containing protein n=1 Tax=Paenibacillus gyeongsangnamensis TaxID=3388067 RepID=A0ABT4QLC1_9BACL|nr:hypothetical protein [Paenibacillus filicis]MCZ8517661.1 hypothetical protein [Paenibacillus filicis]
MDYPINEDYIVFYTQYFNDNGKAIDFLNRCYNLTDINVFPRRLVNQLARTISFTDFTFSHRLGNRSFQIFMWMALIESYEYIQNPEIDSEKVDKLGVILKFFRTYLSKADNDLLVKYLKRSIVDKRFNNNSELPIDIISRIFYSIRNEFSHGLEYHTSLFSDSNENNFLESINLREFKKDSKENRYFEMSITHEQLRGVIIRASLNLIHEQINQSTS